MIASSRCVASQQPPGCAAVTVGAVLAGRRPLRTACGGATDINDGQPSRRVRRTKECPKQAQHRYRRRHGAALRRWRTHQSEERLLLGAAWSDTGLVFTREDGVLVHPDTMSYWFERHVRSAGVPRIRFHDLRHTQASIALQAGVPAKVVSERLGHATVAFTLDVYSHVVPGLHGCAISTSTHRGSVGALAGAQGGSRRRLPRVMRQAVCGTTGRERRRASGRR